MNGILNMLLFLCYGWITLQDFKTREVYLISFLLLGVLLSAKSIFVIMPDTELIQANCAVLGIIVSMVALYYMFRYGLKFMEKLKSGIGLGDLLLVPVLVVCFSPFNFILFLILSLFVSLFFWAVSHTSNSKEATVPFAGIQTLLLNIVIIMEQTGYFNSYTDLISLY